MGVLRYEDKYRPDDLGNYIIVVYDTNDLEESFSTFAEEISMYIEAGWTPTGGLVCQGTSFLQSLYYT